MTEHRINIMEPEIPAVQKPAASEEPKVVYAAVTERFVALLIDYGIIFIPVQLILSLVLKLTSPMLSLWGLLAVIFGMNALFLLYETVLSCGDRVTLGKSLVGIAVMKKDLSGPLSFPKAFVRAVGYYISAALLMCGFLVAFFDDRHRALHDFLGGSVVVQVREKSWLERAAVRFLGGILLAAFAWTAYSQFFGGGELLEKYQVDQARRHLRKVALLEEAHYTRYGKYTNDLLRLSLLSGDPVQFQRDTQKVLAPKGFKIGVNGNRYKISAVARDQKNTPVYYSPGE